MATSKGKTGATGKAGPVGPRWSSMDITKMDEKLDKLISAIYEGNGHRPLMERVAIIEEHMGTMLEASTKRDEAIIAMTKTCADATGSIKAHVGRPHVFTLLGNLRFWGYLLIAFVMAHAVFDLAYPLIAALIKAWTGVQLP